MRLKAIICLLLAGITLAIYWPASHFMFLYHDDTFFLGEPQVAAGLSSVGIDWAMKAVVVANWHPITLFSFLLVHQFFGLNPGAEHMVNVAFHAANAVLLFLVLAQMMGTLQESSPSPHPSPPRGRGGDWLCAIVAAIFAWHPLHVESVAWISERKDVLFAFFMLLSLWCYTLYAQAEQIPPELSTTRKPAGDSDSNDSPSPLPSPQHSEYPLMPSPGLRPPSPAPAGEGFAGRGRTIRPAKNAKPGFLSRHGYYNLAFAFFIFSLLSKAMTVTLPFLLLLLDYWPLHRLNRSTLRDLLFEKARFFVAAAFFCGLTFWIHRNSADVESLQIFGIGGRIENAILSYVNYPGKLFWPVNLAIPYPYPENFDGVQVLLGALLLLAISALCLLQISRRPYLAVGWFWYLISMLPVIGLVQIGGQAMADRHTYITLIGPTVSLVWLVWEWVRTSSWLKYAAISATAIVLAVCMVLTEKQLQYWKDTVTLFSHTAAVAPGNALTEVTLALGLQHEGLLRQAATHYRMAIASRGYGDEHYLSYFYSAEVMAKLGYYEEAEKRLEAALQLSPNSTDAINNLAWLLATCPDSQARDGKRAVNLAEHACELTHYQNPTFLTTLAAAYAEAGRFDEAIDMTQKAIALAEQYEDAPLYEASQELLQSYQAHKTYAETHAATSGK